MKREESFSIRLGAIKANEAIPFDIYVELNEKLIHYLKQGDSLSAEKIKKLDGSSQFRVPIAQKSFFKKFIHGKIVSSTTTAQEKAIILRDASIALVEEIYENPNIGEALEDSKQVVGDFVEMMEHSPESMGELISLSSHDFYTYNHSLDVSIYALGIGKLMGYSKEELTELGRGSLFHDIGKKWVDADIICKEGPLTDEEWIQMRKHPEYGLKILSEFPDVSTSLKACCYEHHESFLGNGYPQTLDGNEIHPMARIVAVSDTYDALTTQRSYNKPMTPKDAIEFITTKLRERYDPEVMKALSAFLTQI